MFASDAEGDPVGQGGEEQDGADDHLGHNVKYWDDIQGDVEMRGSVKGMNNCIHPDHSDGDEEGEEGCGDCVYAV